MYVLCRRCTCRVAGVADVRGMPPMYVFCLLRCTCFASSDVRVLPSMYLIFQPRARFGLHRKLVG